MNDTQSPTQTQTLRGTSVMPNLTVNNLEKSRQFFEALGFEVEDKSGGGQGQGGGYHAEV